ncbi:MAG: Gmad2 immunoglobulin-like domain-containing protein [Terricaulis sp.]
MRFIAALCALALAACSQPQPAPAPAPGTPATTAETAAATEVTTDALISGARVTSPFVVEGSAPGDWYFEAQFVAKLVGADGVVIAEAPARAQSDWMTEAPVRYRAEFTFAVTQDTPATLVLQEDMPADNASPREVTIPVVLVPR